MSDDESETKPVTDSPSRLSRRALLAGVGGLGLLAATGTASAAEGDHLTETWSGDPGTPGLTIDVGSGTDRAFVGATADPSGIAIQGVAHDGSGRNKGIAGKTKSSDGIGLLGNAVATTGGAKGLEGRSAAKFGTGVIGFAKHDTGQTKGVRGIAQSPQGRGVEGINTAGSGTTYGVRGAVESPDGYGLYTPDDARVDGTVRAGSHRTARHPRADVTAHGAAGDGSTDDTAAVRAARDAVDAGGVVFFPAGTYLVSEAVDRKGRAFVGVSPFAATVTAASGGAWDTGGKSNATAVLYDRAQDRSLVRSLGVDLDGADAAGIACFGGRRLVLRNNYVVGGTDSGVQFWGNDVGGERDCVDGRIENNLVENCKWNLVLDGACRNCAVRDNVSRSPGSRHVSLDSKQSADDRPMLACSVADNSCRSSGGSIGGAGAIQVRSDVEAGVTVADNYVYDWPGNGIKVEDATSITGNVVEGASDNQVASGVLLDGSRQGLSLKDNVVVEAGIGYNAKSGTGAADVVGNVAVRCGDPSEWEQAYDDDWVIRDNHKYDGSGGKPDGTTFGRVRSSGTVTVSAGSTSAQYGHDLMATPGPEDVLVTAMSSLGNASSLFVSNRAGDHVEVSLDADPGQDVEVAVRIDLNG